MIRTHGRTIARKSSGPTGSRRTLPARRQAMYGSTIISGRPNAMGPLVRTPSAMAPQAAAGHHPAAGRPDGWTAGESAGGSDTRLLNVLLEPPAVLPSSRPAVFSTAT